MPATPADAVAEAVARARRAQRDWGPTPLPSRIKAIRRFWVILARDAGAWAELIASEVGKPRVEAMAEVVSTLDLLRWTVRNAGRVLADQRIGPGWQRWMLMPAGRLRWQPFGVIGILGTWNYPLFLNAPAIAQAVVAGNGVVWKPSELAALVGQRLQQSVEEAALPDGLVTAVFGGPEVGEALVASAIDKGLFTGGVANGRRVLGELGRRGIPAVAELSGFDPAIVLPDAPVASSANALAWGAFLNAGQTCVAVKRVYVVGRAGPWVESLAVWARALRVGDPSTRQVDMGPMITEAARDRFDQTIRAAVAAGAQLYAGGRPLDLPGWFYAPTVLKAETPEPEGVLAGCFGPVVVVRGVPDVEAAVAAANASEFGLTASVWGRDRRAARAVAQRLQAGMVGVNEVVAPSAHAAAPFGGVKASGHGRVHGAIGLREFTTPQVIHTKPSWAFRPQIFPYTPRLNRVLAFYRRMFHHPRG